MSVKMKTSLFRDFLYLHEVITHGKISSAALKNGIKASNLSNIVKNLEKIISKKLFLRHANGLIPTTEALNLDKQITYLENLFDKTAAFFVTENHFGNIALYLPENLHFDNLEKFCREHSCTISKAEVPEQADVIVSYVPINIPEMITVENTIGRQIRQTIWIASINKEKPLRLAEQLITWLHNFG